MYNRQYLFTHTLTLSIIFYEYVSSRFKRLYRSGHNVAMLARLRVRVLFRPCANAVCLAQSHRQVDVAWAAIIIIMPRLRSSPPNLNGLSFPARFPGTDDHHEDHHLQ